MAFELLQDTGFELLPEEEAPTARPVVTPTQPITPIQAFEQVQAPAEPEPTEQFLGTPLDEFSAFERVVIGAGKTAGQALGVFEIPGIAIRDLIAGAEFGTGTTAREVVGADVPGQEPSILRDVVLPTAVEFATTDLPFFVPVIRGAKAIGEGVKRLVGKAAKIAEPEAVVKEAPSLLPSLAPEGVVFSKGLSKADKSAIRQSVKKGDVTPKDKVVPSEGMNTPKVVNSTTDDIVEQAVKDSNKGKAKVHYDEPILDDVKVVVEEKAIGPTQVVRDGISTLEATGPIGRAGGRVLRTMEQAWERRTSQNIVDLENVLTREFGKRVALPFTKRLNPLRNKGIQKQWKITEAENEAMVNYLYSSGDSKWLAALGARAQQRVKNVADEFFRITKSINEQEGIQALERHLPDGSTKPFGRPSMFFMQQPESAKLITAQSEKSLLRFLQRARVEQNNPHLTIGQFKQQMKSQHDKFGEVSDHSQFVRGLEDTRVYDASNGNTESAFRNLKEMGYGVDPLRNMARYAINANRKAQLVENADILVKMETDLLGVLPRNQRYINRLFEEFKGTSVELADEFATNFWAKVRSFNASTLLQFATVNNLNQFTFIAQRGGILRTMRAALSQRGFTIPLVGGKQIDDVSRRSGALYNIYMQELSAPRHRWSQWAQTVLHVNGFTAAEKWMRHAAANVGGMHITMLAKSAVKQVNNPKRFDLIRRQLDEFGIDANAVAARGGLLEEEALGGVQRFANEVTGRRTLGGVPLFVTNHAQLNRTILQFKEFMFTNVAEMSRVMVNSPSVGIAMKRLTRGLAASLVVGEMTRDVSFFLTGGGTVVPSSEERVPKALLKVVGNATAARAIDNVIAGYANIAMVLAATFLQSQSFGDLFGGPAVGFIDDIFVKGPVAAVTRRVIGPRRPGPPDITGEGFGSFGEPTDFGGF